jgi:hypothetical protein
MDPRTEFSTIELRRQTYVPALSVSARGGDVSAAHYFQISNEMKSAG